MVSRALLFETIYFRFHYFYVLLFSSLHHLIIFVGIIDNVQYSTNAISPSFSPFSPS